MLLSQYFEISKFFYIHLSRLQSPPSPEHCFSLVFYTESAIESHDSLLETQEERGILIFNSAMMGDKSVVNKVRGGPKTRECHKPDTQRRLHSHRSSLRGQCYMQGSNKAKSESQAGQRKKAEGRRRQDSVNPSTASLPQSQTGRDNKVTEENVRLHSSRGTFLQRNSDPLLCR